MLFSSLYQLLALCFVNLLQSSSADRIAVVAVCCQSMSVCSMHAIPPRYLHHWCIIIIFCFVKLIINYFVADLKQFFDNL